LSSDDADVAARLGALTKELEGKTVLLTGAAGFLGRHFRAVFAELNEHVLATPARLVAVDNLITGAPPGKDMVQHDVTKPLDWEGPLDFIVHAAGIASPYHYRTYPLETLEVAVTGTRNMLELARSTGARFLYFSSSEIYGDPDERHIPTQESFRGYVSPVGPRAPYDEGKRVGETLCHIFHERFGVHTNQLRPFNVYGPGMAQDDYRVLPNFASRIRSGLPLNVYGSGRQTRTFCYVSDALVGFFLTLLKGVPGEAYNIGTPTPEISMVDLADKVREVVGDQVRINRIDYPDSYPADEPMRRCPDITKARLQLGFEPQVSLDDGLRRFFDWALEAYSARPG
jgi:UDP-glucuronate decarboxylase